MNRRQAIKNGLKYGAGIGFISNCTHLDSKREPALYTAAAKGPSEYCLIGLDGVGTQRFSVPLPGRAHAIASDPQGKTLTVFGRRPGFFMEVYHPGSGAHLKSMTPSPGTCFTGHGTYSSDGHFLYVSRNNFEAGLGEVACYNTESFTLVKVLSAHGIGTHEIVNQVGSNNLWVANGGVRTHPDFGRAKLNLDTMKPNLSLVNTSNGKMEGQYKLTQGNPRLSIRHITTKGQSLLAGLQYFGDDGSQWPVVAELSGESLRLIPLPNSIKEKVRNYCGSIVLDHTGKWAAASSPKGGVVMFFRQNPLGFEFYGSYLLKDVCGLAPLNQEGCFVISSGTGKVIAYDAANEGVISAGGFSVAFDNHMIASYR